MSEPYIQHITLQLDAHHISLNVPSDKEYLYRRVYVALDMAVNLHANASANSLQPIEEKINELNQLILKELSKQ